MNRILSMHFIARTIIFAIIISTLGQSDGFAQSSGGDLLNNDPSRLARGIGHFERSRSLLLAAIREFDSGYKYAKTDQLLDADLWRQNILSRAKELEVILSPKAREIKAGSSYEPNPALIGPKVIPPSNFKTQPAKPGKKIGAEAKSGSNPTKGIEEIEPEVQGS